MFKLQLNVDLCYTIRIESLSSNENFLGIDRLRETSDGLSTIPLVNVRLTIAEMKAIGLAWQVAIVAAESQGASQ